jgi:hypothetical protein
VRDCVYAAMVVRQQPQLLVGAARVMLLAVPSCAHTSACAVTECLRDRRTVRVDEALRAVAALARADCSITECLQYAPSVCACDTSLTVRATGASHARCLC